jgi:hypothetical protein
MTMFGPARFVPHKNYSGPPITWTCGLYKRGRFVPKNVPPFHEPGYGQLPFDDYAALVAIKYAKWLAARDGIEIPRRLKTRPVWGGFYSAWRKRRQRYWDGVRTVEVWCKRIQAVEWGHEEERYNQRKDGTQGAWTHNEWVADLRIDIPHWDFEHPPIEACEILDAAA